MPAFRVIACGTHAEAQAKAKDGPRCILRAASNAADPASQTGIKYGLRKIWKTSRKQQTTFWM